jgi:hypothetical protein
MVSRYDDDWLIKVYRKFTPKPGCSLKRPEEHHEAPFCTIDFEYIKTLPSWEAIHNFHPDIIQICKELNSERPWVAYFQAAETHIGKSEIASQIGGYPQWIQSDETPAAYGEPIPLLFQLDSEDDAGLMFQDMGLLYCFLENTDSEPELILQSC